jgi:choline-sulfatase
MKHLLLLALLALAIPLGAASRPNILFIAIDDLNDWVGPLRGHPQVQTPQMDRLAARGTTFSNAHCQAPLCNPSRASLMMGLRPTSTGIYGLAPWFRNVEEFKDHVTLPQYLAAHGYRTYSAGKIYHSGYPPQATRAKEMHVWGPPGGIGITPKEKLIPPTPMGNHPLMDWGIFPHRDEQKGDWQVATWAIERLQEMPKDEPFFLAAGFFLPHVPCYATEKWFELYPEETLLLPPVKPDDRDQTPRFSWYLHWNLPEPRLKWVREAGQWRNLVRSYLACISFIDHQVGRLLDALEATGLAGNTIVVLWSDHGYHLGEKLITGKNTLWERSTRVPLILAGPGISKNANCARPAELLDLFPTLIELCGLPERPDLEGRSLVPQLKDAKAPRSHPAITSHNQGNHAIRSERWRYIRYADGSEELYDMANDPNEWINLAGKPEHASTIAEHRQWLPRVDRPPAPGSAHRVLTFAPQTGAVTWEGKPVRPDDAIPE